MNDIKSPRLDFNLPVDRELYHKVQEYAKTAHRDDLAILLTILLDMPYAKMQLNKSIYQTIQNALDVMHIDWDALK